MDAEQVVRDKLLSFATSKRYDEEVARAFEMFWGGRRKLAERLNEADSARFLDWYVFDYRTKGNGKTPVELFQEFRAHTLPDDQRKLLQHWHQTRFGLFAVTAAVRGRQIELQDVFDKDVVTVQSPEGCPLAKDDLVFARVMNLGSALRISGAVTRVPPSAREAVAKHLAALFDEYSRGRSTARWRDFFREQGHRVNHFLTDLADGRAGS